ncbi:MAG TPA: prenyltransferase/squalene oxidase repeat-containing protein [bacterium]|nr:prenyltransferase/squalene oxidase repeat-containing protein [bacterium]
MAVLAAPRVPWIDWGRTIAYIDHNGSEMERARLRGILGRPRPDAKVVRALEARQNEDGGFPYEFVQGRVSTIDATATALNWLEDLRLFDGPHVERALVFLLADQRPDGSWDEPPGILRYAPPPRLLPSDLRVRTASTALVGYWLARAGGRDDAIGRAAAYLRGHQAPGGRFVGFLRTTWLATAFLHLVEGPGSDAAVRGLQALGAVDGSRWRPGALADMLVRLGGGGVEDDTPVVVRTLERLCVLSQPDGSWVSEDGDAYHVEATLQALRALLHYGGDTDAPEGAGDALPEANFADEEIRG